MEKFVRKFSETLFGLNYLGIICGGAFTFVKATEHKQLVFKQTALMHCGFLINNYLLSFLKLRAYPHHLSIQLLNDSACFLSCFPTYAVWAYNDALNFFKPPKISVIDQISDLELTPE